jgi:hypothetical protein
MEESTSGFATFIERIKRNPVMTGVSVLATVVAVVVSFTGNVRELLGLFDRPDVVAVAGRWVSDELTNPFDPRDRYQLVLDLQSQGGAVVGNVEERRTDGRTAGPRGIADGKLDGRTVSFHTREQSIYGSETVSYRNIYLGEVAPQEIRFTLQSDRPWGFPTQTFTARRE